MNKFAKCVFLLLTLPIALTSCGSGSDSNSPSAPQREEEDNSPNPPPIPTPTPTPTPTQDRDIRYSAFEMRELSHDYFDTVTDFKVKIQFNRRPLVIAPVFSEKTIDESTDEVVAEQKCDFKFNLTDSEADELEAIADEVRVCTFNNHIISDGTFSAIEITDSEGKIKDVLKYKVSEVLGKHLYLCRGRTRLYQYVGDLVKAKAPGTCPESYRDMFQDYDEGY